MKAAERLCVTPSAVSHALRDFEQSLGTELFERTSEGVQPTTAGQRFYAKVKPLVVGIEAAERELMSTMTPEQTDFTFASIHTIRFLMGYIRKHDFKFFGYYRIVLGAIVLVYFGITAFIG